LNFKEFGWNGLFFEIPEEMRFIRQGGNAKSGHLRLEAEDCFLEAKWEPFKPKKAKSLSGVAEELVKQMKKKDKKRNVKILGKNRARVSTHNSLYMVVRSDVDERVYIWYCNESQRIVIFRFVFKLYDGSSKIIMKRLFDTLKCHYEKSNVWSLLNLRFESPIPFFLTDSRIAVGRVHFMLADNKLSTFAEKTSKILIEYYSMANLIYKENYRDPDKWLEQNYLKDLRKRFKKTKIKFGTMKSRRFRRHKMVVKHETKTFGVSWRKTAMYTNATWYCSSMNRMYSITVSSSTSRPLILKRELEKGSHTQVFEDLLTSFKCH
jgi:hypothetical protein